MSLNHDDGMPRPNFERFDSGAPTRSAVPDPLPCELSKVDPFPLDALPDAFRPWVADVAERMQCPPDFVAVPMLVAAASLVARHVAIRPQVRSDWTERANLWALIVGRPGAMKSPAIMQALAPLERMEKQARQQRQHLMQQYLTDALAGKLRGEAREGEAKKRLKANPDADVSALLSAAQELAPPPCPRYIVNDTTYEALGVILSENPGGVLSTRDEMRSLLMHLAKEENVSQRGFFLQAWSGGSYTFDRIGRGKTIIEDARLSMIGGIQPGPLSELVRQSRRGGADDGMLERFLIAWPDDPHEWRNVDRWPDSSARRAALDAFAHLDALTPEKVGAQQDTSKAGNTYGPHYLRFDPAAHELFTEWRTDLERTLRDTSAEGIEAALSKYRHHVPALALVSHVVDGNQGPIGEAATIKALALAEYFESHAKRCHASSRRATVRAAKAIMGKLKSGALQEPFTTRDVHQKGWAGLSDVGTVTDALDMLAAHHWVMESATDTGGRPKTLYSLTEGARHG